MLSSYWDSILTIAAILAIASVGLHITMLTGQFSIMHGALMGLGAYAAGIAARDLGWSFIAALLAASLVGGLTGGVVSIALGRLGGLMLGIATLAVGEMFEILANTFFPGGPAGYSQVPVRTTSVGALGILIGLLMILWLVGPSRIGTAMAAVGSDPVVADSLGISPARVRAWAFAAGGSVAGIAGGLSVQFLGVVIPSDLGFAREIQLLTFVILGGMQTPWGGVLGAFGLITGQEALRVATLDRGWILGILLTLTMLLRPQGILSRRRLRARATGPGGVRPGAAQSARRM